MRPHAVILFAGDARREEAEKGLPPRFLARLHAEQASMIRSAGGVDLYIASDAGSSFLVEGPRFTSRSPRQSLGAKVDEAITSCFAAGYERVAIVAGDVAGLTRELLIDAFRHQGPAVGRSPDGGFYLAAFSEPPRVAWTALPWSTAEIHDALVAQLDDPYVLPALPDIDSFADALTVVRSLPDLRRRPILLSLLLHRSPQPERRTPPPLARPRTTDRPRPPPAA